MPTFEPFPKIARISKPAVFSEKIDGTNAQIYITNELEEDKDAIPIRVWNDENDCRTLMYAGSRNRWLGPGSLDNFAFWNWAYQNAGELSKLGPGRHFGEWYGKGIQRGYGLDEKRFSLFNAARWSDGRDVRPGCVSVVPVLHIGPLTDSQMVMEKLLDEGSRAVPGFKAPEGIVIYYQKTLYKKTFEYDQGKWTGVK
jgi:hypothetical protein